MSLKIAVASSDGKFVNQHFGHARRFLIFEVGEAGSGNRFVENRENKPACGGSDSQHGSSLADTASLIADCQVVIVSQIGPSAREKVYAKGVLPLEIPDYIDNALDRALHAYYQLNPGKKMFRSSR